MCGLLGNSLGRSCLDGRGLKWEGLSMVLPEDLRTFGSLFHVVIESAPRTFIYGFFSPNWILHPYCLSENVYSYLCVCV